MAAAMTVTRCARDIRTPRHGAGAPAPSRPHPKISFYPVRPCDRSREGRVPPAPLFAHPIREPRPLTLDTPSSINRRVITLASAKPAGTARRAARAARGASLALRSAPEEISPNASVSLSCSIDDPASCSLADLEMMYIDSLWNYYNGGDFTLTDEQYDRLRDELNWQGSGFPTLRRYEVQFVEAAISYARGEAKVTDQEYEELKRKVRSAGKRDDVTALLLYTKGQQLLEPAQFEQLRDEMAKLSIDVGLRGATCTLSNTSTDLIADSGTVTKMYTALAIVPSLIGIVPYLGASIFGVDVPPAAGLGFAATIALGLTSMIVNYTNLQNATVVTGQCPCCEEPIKQFFGGEEPATSMDYKCPVCGTQSKLDRVEMKIKESGGLSAN